jgi:hypothetical protein
MQPAFEVHPTLRSWDEAGVLSMAGGSKLMVFPSLEGGSYMTFSGGGRLSCLQRLEQRSLEEH